uniref:t-SNARE coiled-coil homology domain-containing protein n=1 Tax=Rhabditophanes sp. KR3021 TaxID=114890 RepID=A0AC35TNK2_9BILA
MMARKMPFGNIPVLNMQKGSGFADGTFTSPEHYEDRIKLMDKINRIKTKIAKAQIACEKDVTEFLHMNKGPSSNLDNPQAVRMKQHFDSKNNKNNKNLESLRKRLAAYEVNLGELDSGTKGTKPFLTAMGANILKTGANVKEMTESVIAAPKSLAKALTGANRKQYGSTGNIALENDGSSVGKSTFYKTAVPSTNMDRIRSLPNHGKFPQEGGTEYPRYGSSDEVISHSDSENAHTSDSNIAINNEHSTKAQRYSKGEVSHISTAINALRNEMDDMKMAYISEMSTLQSENQILSRVMQVG